MISLLRPTDELDIVLNNPATKRALREVRHQVLMDNARMLAKAYDDDETDNPKTYIDCRECGSRDQFRARRREYESILNAHVIDKLTRPHSVTLRDLSRLFFEHMLVPVSEFDDAFDRFTSLACGLAEDLQQTKPFSIARMSRGSGESFDPDTVRAWGEDGPSHNDLREMLERYEQRGLETISPGSVLWGPTLMFGPALKVVGCLPRAYSSEREPHHKNDEMLVLAAVSGELSPLAGRRLAVEMKQAVRAICRSYSLLFLRPSILPERRWPIPLEADDVGVWGNFVRECLDYYYRPRETKKTNTIGQRIQNAIHLMVEADRQERRGISHALCMTALEALLGEDGPDISSRLARNAAVLLEPDTSLRKQARKFIKELYKKRNKVLHGENLEVDERTLLNARLLVSAVLKSIIDWSRHARSFEGLIDPTPKQLFDKLEVAGHLGDRVDGVIDLPSVRNLWKEPAVDRTVP